MIDRPGRGVFAAAVGGVGDCGRRVCGLDAAVIGEPEGAVADQWVWVGAVG